MTEFWIFFKMGLYHVVNWQAYTHILFLVVLAAAYNFNMWKRLLVLITLITLGFLLSLLMVSYGVIHVSLGLIGFLIAATILVGALFNIFTAGKEKQREKMGLWFAFALFFGLLRGLAFAPHFNASVGQRNKMLPSLEVALGIEAGQLLVVLIVLILAFLLQTLFRFNKRDWILVISSIVLGLAIPLLLANWIF